ncbi:molybdopterin dinucleotide binding domain protein [Maioricimonas rarisocia]|uniref:Molybdopterin dinucleotide binding domain protein n=1 Tax=Maioricimonas rarisocia TaxID=2528026 RepID=A0A517Z1Z9_9PLAN|nr:molybdopterin dinucleotide binding domain-containing protein [Maioricimonas rarisocia]QDU36501.1 molybdopterin dinucleotide binding domain protein [Maioricimonas rarisocia]
MPEQFILIPGRTSTQGTTLNEGKYTDGYVTETSTLQMCAEDMERLGVANGDSVRVWNDVGEVVVPVTTARKDELPPGLLFISYGDKSSRLMGGETHASGMPDSKGLDVWLEKLNEA